MLRICAALDTALLNVHPMRYIAGIKDHHQACTEVDHPIRRKQVTRIAFAHCIRAADCSVHRILVESLPIKHSDPKADFESFPLHCTLHSGPGEFPAMPR
ncbi:hypothetical protein PSP6_690074 [Paraburkholderia tropica]|nr:hypothetical protein PSP6_690074 [Paraburkholderia tropica]